MGEREGENIVKIPESITINGVVYTVKDTPELQQFIQQVAKVEKSKLYTQFENLKSQIANLGRVQVNGSADTDAIVEKLKGVFVTKADLEQDLPKILKEVVQPVLTATEQNRQEDLNNYREKLINENLAVCIPELVKGNTKEEILNSLNESIRIRAAYPSTGGVPAGEPRVVDPLIRQQESEIPGASAPTPQPAPSVPPVQTPPMAPRRSSPDAGDGGINVRQMSMDEFARQRESLKSQLESLYGSNF